MNGISAVYEKRISLLTPSLPDEGLTHLRKEIPVHQVV